MKRSATVSSWIVPGLLFFGVACKSSDQAAMSDIKIFRTNRDFSPRFGDTQSPYLRITRLWYDAEQTHIFFTFSVADIGGVSLPAPAQYRLERGCSYGDLSFDKLVRDLTDNTAEKISRESLRALVMASGYFRKENGHKWTVMNCRFADN
jgi:hypothetical protein